MDKVKFLSPTDKELGKLQQRALIINCKIDDAPSVGEISLACDILARAHHANADIAFSMIENERFFKDAVEKYRHIK